MRSGENDGRGATQMSNHVMDADDQRQLMMRFSHAVREGNRAIINAMIPEISLDDLAPVIALLARIRGGYLRQLLEITEGAGEGLPRAEEIEKLSQLRSTYEEMSTATQALEVALERGYLDIKQ